MFNFKPQSPYWMEFSSYQTFETVEAMIEQIKLFESTYDLTPAAKSVLNTIKLYSKRTFVGVCWLYREEIAKKAGVSLSTVKRTLKSLQATGILTVHPFMHTKRGGKTHNIYVINPIFEPSQEPSNEPSVEGEKEPSKPYPATDSDVSTQTHKNSHTNSNNSLNHLSNKGNELKFIPDKFIDLMDPFYANDPEIIRKRWKTVCVAVKRSCIDFSYTSWDTIGQAWKDTVKKLKRGRIRSTTDYGVGGYFYGVLCDYLMNDYLRNALTYQNDGRNSI